MVDPAEQPLPLSIHAEPAEPGAEAGRASYQPPRLEHLGPWQAFTLQQSVPIFP